MKVVAFKKLNNQAVIPQYKTDGAAGMDLAVPSNFIWTLQPNEIKLVRLGFAIKIPEGYEGQVRSRSGASLKGLLVANAPGTIDSDYTGEVGVILINVSEKAIEIMPEDRVAQLVFAPVAQAVFKEVDELGVTQRGSGGFGSTGK